MQANSLELISWAPHSSLEREKKLSSLVYSIKRQIRHFPVVAATAKKCTKKVCCTCLFDVLVAVAVAVAKALYYTCVRTSFNSYPLLISSMMSLGSSNPVVMRALRQDPSSLETSSLFVPVSVQYRFLPTMSTASPSGVCTFWSKRTSCIEPFRNEREIVFLVTSVQYTRSSTRSQPRATGRVIMLADKGSCTRCWGS